MVGLLVTAIAARYSFFFHFHEVHIYTFEYTRIRITLAGCALESHNTLFMSAKCNQFQNCRTQALGKAIK